MSNDLLRALHWRCMLVLSVYTTICMVVVVQFFKKKNSFFLNFSVVDPFFTLRLLSAKGLFVESTHTHSHTLSLSLTHTHTHEYTHTLSLTHTHTRTHAHTRARFQHTHTRAHLARTDDKKLFGA
jgi:hypothetical protein